MVAATLGATGTSAAPATPRKLPVSGTGFAAHTRPAQPTRAERANILAAQTTTESRCLNSTDTLVLSIESFDPANPGTLDVVFHRETAADASGKARIWVAWDFLATA